MSTQPLLQRTANKRIALPVRVEPKVAFANERTFLSWLHFTVVLGGLAVGLLNFGDRIGKISAGMFSIVDVSEKAMSVMIYALYTYHWRAASIRRGGRGPYDDRLGPTVLCIALLGKKDFRVPIDASRPPDLDSCFAAAVVTNFILRFTES
ncbi:hypothetical protein A7U60_g3271 [Sanghuangporus baumii]|uniref:DUF202 domain-containing protein n=1 Tax=Sanghuangporus baumii TaxID=108892 RepID=A0A9Q5I133_SANBA|nr:hypothetical protein A7U60_g3271 [Sanghuangporus baumii]